MEWLPFLSKAVTKAGQQADLPSPDVAGASDGDGWLWRWELPRQATDAYRGDLTLVFKLDAFGERLLLQLVASARSQKKTSDAWTQNYPLAHLSLRHVRAHDWDALTFESALGAQLRGSWHDLRERAPRLDEIGRRQADARNKLEKRGLRIT
jgi:hypothetical protein